MPSYLWWQNPHSLYHDLWLTLWDSLRGWLSELSVILLSGPGAAPSTAHLLISVMHLTPPCAAAAAGAVNRVGWHENFRNSLLWSITLSVFLYYSMCSILFVHSHVFGLLLIFSLSIGSHFCAGNAGRELQLFNSPSVPPKPTSQAHFLCRPHPVASLPPLYPSPADHTDLPLLTSPPPTHCFIPAPTAAGTLWEAAGHSSQLEG